MGTRTPMEELRRRRRSFLAFVRRRVASEALAEDLLQLGLLRASERIHQLRDQDRAVEWFFQVLRRLIKSKSWVVGCDYMTFNATLSPL